MLEVNSYKQNKTSRWIQVECTARAGKRIKKNDKLIAKLLKKRGFYKP